MNSNKNNLTTDSSSVKGFSQGRRGAVDAGFMVIWCSKENDVPKRSQFFGPGDSDKAAVKHAE